RSGNCAAQFRPRRLRAATGDRSRRRHPVPRRLRRRLTQPAPRAGARHRLCLRTAGHRRPLPLPMNRLRALLPLLVLFAVGLALLASGVLDRFDPHDLAADEAVLRGDLASHPWLGALLQVFAIALVIATGVPGGIVVVLAGGMLFGTVLGTLLSSIGAL